MVVALRRGRRWCLARLRSLTYLGPVARGVLHNAIRYVPEGRSYERTLGQLNDEAGGLFEPRRRMKKSKELVRTGRFATHEALENLFVIQSDTNRPRPVGHVLFNYILIALGQPSNLMRQVDGGLPTSTVSVEPQDVVLSFTCLHAPHFRVEVRTVAQAQARDVVMVRFCRSVDVFPVSADVTLAGGGLAPFDLIDLELYRHSDGALWLVPPTFGAAIQLTTDGLILQMVPPYRTMRERSRGIYCATGEIAAQIFPQVTR